MKLYHTCNMVIEKGSSVYAYLENIAKKANNLYNATLFRIRQVYTSLYKEESKHTPNEKEVWKEIDRMLLFKPKFSRPCKEHPYMSYPFLYHLLYVNDNPDYICPELPSQTGQQMMKNAVKNMKAYGKSVADWKKHPDKYKVKPRLPYYKRPGGKSTFFFTNQQVRICGGYFRFPLTGETLRVPKYIKDDWRLKQVDVVPNHNNICISFVFEEIRNVPELRSPKRICAIDLGVKNFAAMTNNAGLPAVLFKGGFVNHANHLYNAMMAEYVSEQTLRTKKKFRPTERSRKWGERRMHRIDDFMHKTAKQVIAFCLENDIDTVVVGENIDWKQKMRKEKRLNKKNRQNFVQVPYDRFKNILEYLCDWNGIRYVSQEESYTSRASYLSRDMIPVYQKGKATRYTFSGVRGYKKNSKFYKCNDGTILNADLNGSANIGRKAFPELYDCQLRTLLNMSVVRTRVRTKLKKNAAGKSAV